VYWNRICTPLHSSGFWRNGCGGMVGREALWRLVIDVKFESLRGGWCSKEVLGTFGVGVWKHIRRG